MSFASSELSENAGRPIFLLKFFRTGKSWFYTNADQNVTFNGDLYTAYPITVPPIIQAGSASPDDITLTMPRSVPLAQYLDLLQPSTAITLMLRKVHAIEDVDGHFTAPAIADAPVCWVGTYAGLGRPSAAIRELVCTTLALARGGLRLSWLSACPFMVYDQNCQVDKSAFAVPLAGVTVVNGTDITAAEASTFTAGYFNGGFIEWESEPGVVERRGIESHAGSTLTMFGTTQSLDTGDSFVLYPGCARIPTVCDGTFNNMIRYGGINHLDGRSPFDGDPVF